mmetsp:Transcript_53336/g.150349  ORF Transcript_53336/g.150349 Transcript_53336/m.150349 type:complete len:520 (+) Transcript_53336:232-1791(+)
MLLLERDPLVLAEISRDPSLTDRPSGLPLHAPRRANLLLWVAVIALTHFDRGAATVAAMDLTAWHGRPVSHSFGDVVALLAWHSIGLALGGMVAGAAFQHASAKAVLVAALLVNSVALFALGVQADAHPAITSVLRLCSGLAASFPTVYLPLWVDEFSPTGANGQWMAIVQLGTPLGQFLGILVAGTVTVTGRHKAGLGWHVALLIQAVLLVPVAVRVLLIPAQQVDAANISTLRARLDSLTLYPAAEGSQLGHNIQSLFRETREMMQGVSRNPLNVWLSLTMCLLHSTAAGLALWAAPYLALSSGAPAPMAVLLISATTLACAPTLGTYAGALACDRLDGFKAGHHAAALRVACVFLALAALAGPISNGVTSFGARLALVAFWLLSTGAILPIVAGVLMTSMPSYLRSFYSASSLLMFHLISFAIIPTISALVMGWYHRLPHGEKPSGAEVRERNGEGLDFGVGLAMWTTVPAAVLLLLAYAREPKCVAPVGLAGVDDLTFSDISYELSRRRISTAPL